MQLFKISTKPNLRPIVEYSLAIV